MSPDQEFNIYPLTEADLHSSLDPFFSVHGQIPHNTPEVQPITQDLPPMSQLPGGIDTHLMALEDPQPESMNERIFLSSGSESPIPEIVDRPPFIYDPSLDTYPIEDFRHGFNDSAGHSVTMADSDNPTSNYYAHSYPDTICSGGNTGKLSAVQAWKQMFPPLRKVSVPSGTECDLVESCHDETFWGGDSQHTNIQAYEIINMYPTRDGRCPRRLIICKTHLLMTQQFTQRECTKILSEIASNPRNSIGFISGNPTELRPQVIDRFVETSDWYSLIRKFNPLSTWIANQVQNQISLSNLDHWIRLETAITRVRLALTPITCNGEVICHVPC